MRAAGGADTLPRPLPLGEGSTWPLQPQNEPARPPRQPVANEEPHRSEPQLEPAARASRSVDTLAGLAEELSAGVEPSEASNAEILRAEPARMPADQPAINAAADQNLAEMAQRLEAALRRPSPVNDSRPAEAAPRAAPTGPRAVADLGPSGRGRSGQQSAANASESKGRPPGKSLYDSLEQEMASLFGPSGG